MSGNYTIKMSLDDGFSGSGAAFNFQGGQYKKIGDKTIDTICTSLYNETYREQFERFQNSQKYPVAWKTCPYPTGSNEINNYYIEDFGSLLPPYIPGGEKWKLEDRIIKDGEILGGVNIYLTLRTEKSLLGVK